ncbi:MAG: hypothetical protein ACI30J_02140 [Paludibacteraceae bacterium]
MITEKDVRDAIMRVTRLAIVRDKIELSIDEIQKIIDVLPEVTGDFPITSVCRDDLTSHSIQNYSIIAIGNGKQRRKNIRDHYCPLKD